MVSKRLDYSLAFIREWFQCAVIHAMNYRYYYPYSVPTDFDTYTYTYTSYPAFDPLQPIYLFRKAKNLVATMTGTDPQGYPTDSETVTYTFDSNNRVATETHTHPGYSYVVTYTY